GLWWWGRRDERSAVAGMVLAMVAVLLLEPSTLPWYYTWALCLAVAFALPDRLRMTVVGMSVFMLVAFQPDDSIWFYRPPYLILALAVSALAAVSLTHRDPLRLGRIVRTSRPTAAT
ncbi:MAG: alpha-(1-_6)-mannopyranosyltransferase A, partial [Gordonia amarae]